MLIKTIKFSLKMILKNFSSAMVVLILPLILFTSGLFLDQKINEPGKSKLAIMVTDEDKSLISSDLVDYLKRSGYEIIEKNREEMVSEIKKQNFDFGIIIPKNFEVDLKSEKNPLVEIMSVKMDSVRSMAKTAVNLRVNRYSSLIKLSDNDPSKMISSMKEMEGKAVTVTSENLNTKNKYSDMGTGVGFALFMMTQSIVTASSVLLKSKFDRTFSRVKSSPVKPLTYVAGISIANILIVSLQVIAFYLISKYVFDSKYAAVASLYIFLFSVGIVLLINALYISAKDYGIQNVIVTVLIPVAMISGSFWSQSFNPDIINRIASITPYYWVNRGVQQLNRGIVRSEFLTTVGVLTAFIILFFMAGIYAFRKSEK